MVKTKIVRVAVLVTAALMLAGCTINLGAGNPRPGMMNDEEGYSASDIMFAQMMIPHHEQAVEMSALAETRTSTPELLDLAAEITAAQTAEIAQMQGWLSAAGSPGEMGDMGGHMGGDGMLSDEEMTALADASGAAFDTLWLTGMIDHHEGAIEMARMVLNSPNAEARALGEEIVESQTEEIALMEQLLADQ